MHAAENPYPRCLCCNSSKIQRLLSFFCVALVQMHPMPYLHGGFRAGDWGWYWPAGLEAGGSVRGGT